ncbi:hypothetical protein PVAND_003866 [Polypedilum vanderplanki]|uniref:Uncharacterized protein n=1 Tax=Polypedilum vanderplanki TaxID=319348 RepID=A0A9J6BVC1_POLVA|nr:hypothetical protein PVAND_003866 [Polypedilum vanderplanki]
MNSHIVTLQESWAVDNEVTTFQTLKKYRKNRLMGRPRAFGTINFCKLNIEPRITDRIEIEKGNSNNHVEISGFKLDNRLTIINIYNNPSSSLELLKQTLLEVKDYIDKSEKYLFLAILITNRNWAINSNRSCFSLLYKTILHTRIDNKRSNSYRWSIRSS